MPNSENQNKFYGKDNVYDKNIKNKINRTDSLVRQGETEYINGNVQIIIPCQETKFWNIFYYKIKLYYKDHIFTYKIQNLKWINYKYNFLNKLN